MQQHPVPRNVTSFQFKLVGDMTLKQFGYLAGGMVLGYIAFRAVPGPGAVKFMLGIIFGSSGAAFAFAPVQGRPLDKWLMAFIKSITTPTQYRWNKDRSLPLVMEPSFKFGTTRISSEKEENAVSATEMKNVDDKLKNYLATKQRQPHELADVDEERALHKANAALGVDQNRTKGAVISHTANLGRRRRAGVISNQQIPTAAAQTKQPNVRSIADILQEKAQGEVPPMSPVATTIDRPTANTEVHVLEAKAASSKGFASAPTQPNAISAVVLDLEGKPLSDILAVIKNEHKMIVRALKSNSLGQIVSNTPLSDGTYYIELEDAKGRFIFDIIKTTLRGGMFQPIQIQAKLGGGVSQVEKQGLPPNDIKSKLFGN